MRDALDSCSKVVEVYSSILVSIQHRREVVKLCLRHLLVQEVLDKLLGVLHRYLPLSSQGIDCFEHLQHRGVAAVDNTR